MADHQGIEEQLLPCYHQRQYYPIKISDTLKDQYRIIAKSGCEIGSAHAHHQAQDILPQSEIEDNTPFKDIESKSPRIPVFQLFTVMEQLLSTGLDLQFWNLVTLELMEGRNLFDPIDHIHNRPIFLTYFDKYGKFKFETEIPKASLEDFVTLTWDAEARPTSSKIILDDLLMMLYETMVQ
ncbi:conserved hypothetical protein [Histoplasma capsulatum var. duboisii H88]|uniref:Uncharacterized protein n=2 Tax=Ajellomyces capsulatus TaxID=5037 RepID=F0UI82_AJEC8|nr:conserved hypothetical protein [Histoplasma capsulatum H143]EGC45538.1 conserved hypothetical protein [Histoplasma capsulatum var. duboisii H88]